MTQPVADTRLHPFTLAIRTLRGLPQVAGGVAAYAFAAQDLDRLFVLVPIAFAIAAGIALLAWSRFRYGLGEREIVIEQGVLSRQRRVIPFERIQDVAIERRLLARLLGVATVKIETGGAAADEGQLESIGLADAERLRDIVRGATPQAAARIADRAAAEPLLFAMSLGRVLYSGPFQFSLVFIAAIFAFLQNVDEFGLIDRRVLAERSLDVPPERWLLLSLATAGALVLLGFLAGVARALARDYGFRLTRAASGLRRRRGLFTLSETVIPIRRMQVARIESGLVSRALGWHRLAFQTLGADHRREHGAQVAAPFARIEEIVPILAEADFPDPAMVAGWRRSPRRSILRRGLGAATVAVLLSGLALLWEERAVLAAAVAVLLAALLAARWTRHRHAEDEVALFVTDGLLKRRTQIMPWGRLQAVAVVAGPLQRRLGLATVAVDTAGAASGRSLAIVDLEQAEAEALAGRVLARFQAARRTGRFAGTARREG